MDKVFRLPYIINGKFLSQSITGVQRFAGEIVLALDKFVDKNQFIIVAPPVKFSKEYKLENIKIIKYGSKNIQLWEQISLPFFVYKSGGTLINLCNSSPLVKPGIVCIHDMTFRRIPKTFSRSFVLWYRLLVNNCAHRSPLILTVSNYSKGEIEKFYPASKGRISVLCNGWEHINSYIPDYSVFDKCDLPLDRDYYFSLGSLTANRNFEWILKTAANNKDCIFYIAGGITSEKLQKQSYELPTNVYLLGRVNDCQLKALMENCKAFISPSLYEGFGIPPLEALACGARVMVSDIPVYHEIFGGAVFYFNPNRPLNKLSNYNLLSLGNPTGVLDKYRWCNAATSLLNMIS